MSYRIELRPAAVRALRKADHQDRSRIKAAIALLARDPRPPRATALRGREGFRVRVGDYRILYTINDDILLVVVVRARQEISWALEGVGLWCSSS
ncbi:type II toxin-antitoxin system RelE family toxin, partial [Candidatus Microthrix parvicella]|uniref:type II toxin-antitoxin system RelE family toxin n=1 Tax=Candidatus Neomicrothrix parvicella TaxID=41950 RepID=UPI0009DBCFCA